MSNFLNIRNGMDGEEMVCLIATSNGIDLVIPLEPKNRHYQEVLDAVIAQGADCWDGDIPEDIQAAADAKLAAGLYQPDPHA
jgi:hypothetical protein